MNQERIKEIENKVLKAGPHSKFEEGACIMEMVSYVAGEKWSDRPQCACPILTTYAIKLNDTFNDEFRQRLKPFILDLIGTRSTDEVQIKRKQLLMFRNVTATYPLILDLIKLPDDANVLRSFKSNNEDMANAAKFLSENKEHFRKAAYAYANANAYANADANANADAYAYAYAYANADAYAYAYAYAYANADADANAYALREKIVGVCIETLRMAIELK